MGRLIIFLLTIHLIYSVALSDAAQANPSWQQEWEKTIEAAKREGQAVIYISGYEAVLPDFEKEFPDIKVVAVTGKGALIAQRVLSERRAGRYLADVVSDGINPVLTMFHATKVLDPLKPLLRLPEVID